VIGALIGWIAVALVLAPAVGRLLRVRLKPMPPAPRGLEPERIDAGPAGAAK